MKKLLEQIALLPYLRLAVEEWFFALSTIGTLEQINGDTFKFAIEQIKARGEPMPLRDPKILDLMHYLNQWSQMSKALIQLNEHIEAEWFDETKKRLSMDDLLPITLGIGFKFASNEPDTLTSLKLKIEQAIRIREGGKSAFYLTNILCLINFKLAKKPLPIESDPHIISIIEKLFRASIVNDLIISITEYEDDTFTLLQSHIRRTNTDLYKKHFLTDKKNLDRLQIITGLLQVDNKEFQPFIEKCLAIIDMRCSLIHSRANATQKLIEFSAKLNWHKETLAVTNTDPLSLFKTKALSLFGKEFTDNRFLDFAMHIAQRNWDDEPTSLKMTI